MQQEAPGLSTSDLVVRLRFCGVPCPGNEYGRGVKLAARLHLSVKALTQRVQ
jgi:hypothetical protein